MGSPKSLNEAACRINADVRDGKAALAAMSYHMSDFRHEMKGQDAAWMQAAIEQEPPRVSAIIDVWLAGLAEYLAQRHGLLPPAWVGHPSRFLHELMYLGSPSQREHYLVNTPTAWGRRNLICGEPEL
jgi:hypothetical protein